MRSMASTTLRPKSEDATERFVFVLLDNFTLLSFASALDALRIANRMLGRTAYEWIFIGEGGQTIAICDEDRFCQINFQKLLGKAVLIFPVDCGTFSVQQPCLGHWIGRCTQPPRW